MATSPQVLRRLLLRWYAREARDLPWRTARDPWRTWVSEVMLQQTRVEAVVPRFESFLQAFPTMQAMACADEAEVLARWSGLGYYRRARLLHAGARFVVERLQGQLPTDRRELERVPGVGRYTAGALLSMAFGLREAALDANVTRVVARLAGVRDPGSAAGCRVVHDLATALVDCATPGDVNEALMDLGSRLCRARSADCGQCPLRGGCAAAAAGDPTAFAGPRARKPPRDVLLDCVVATAGRRVLLLRHPGDAPLLAGLWDLPSRESDPKASAPAVRRALASLVLARAGVQVGIEGPVATVRHAIVGRRITARVHVASLPPRLRSRLADDALLVTADDFAKLGLPALPAKVLRALNAAGVPAAKPPARGAARGAVRR